VSRIGSATALMGILPEEVVSELLQIWEQRESCEAVLQFGGGRCLVMKTVRTKRFRDDNGLDNVGGVG